MTGVKHLVSTQVELHLRVTAELESCVCVLCCVNKQPSHSVNVTLLASDRMEQTEPVVLEFSDLTRWTYWADIRSSEAQAAAQSTAVNDESTQQEDTCHRLTIDFSLTQQTVHSSLEAVCCLAEHVHIFMTTNLYEAIVMSSYVKFGLRIRIGIQAHMVSNKGLILIKVWFSLQLRYVPMYSFSCRWNIH